VIDTNLEIIEMDILENNILSGKLNACKKLSNEPFLQGYSTWDGFAAMPRSQMQQFWEDGHSSMTTNLFTEATRVLSRVLLWWLWGWNPSHRNVKVWMVKVSPCMQRVIDK